MSRTHDWPDGWWLEVRRPEGRPGNSIVIGHVLILRSDRADLTVIARRVFDDPIVFCRIPVERPDSAYAALIVSAADHRPTVH